MDEIDLTDAAENCRKMLARFLSNPSKAKLQTVIEEMSGYMADHDALINAVGEAAMEGQNPSGAIEV